MGCLPLRRRQPVVICGGGIIGCATAYYLAKKGVSSIILEVSGVATGASGKGGGFLARDWLKGTPADELSVKSFEMHMTLSQEFTECGYRRLDTLAVTAKHGRRRKSIGLCPKWLGHHIQQVTALGAKNNTAQVHPQRLTKMFLQKAKSMVGVEVRMCEVTGVIVDSKKNVTGVNILDGTTPGVVHGSQVVLALGPWSNMKALTDLGMIEVGYHKAASIVIGHVHTTPHAVFMSYTPRARPTPRHSRHSTATFDGARGSTGTFDHGHPSTGTLGNGHPSTGTFDGGSHDHSDHDHDSGLVQSVSGSGSAGSGPDTELKHYEWYPRPDNTLYICGEDEALELPAFTTDVLPSDKAIEKIIHCVNDLCPGYTDHVAATQACYLPVTQDGMPLIGKVASVNGLHVATGHSVWGILFAPATGEAIAQLIVDGQCTLLDLTDFDPCREVKSPEFSVNSMSTGDDPTSSQESVDPRPPRQA